MKKRVLKKVMTVLILASFLIVGMTVSGGHIITADYSYEGLEPMVRVAYLTFDDGPYREITPYILDILKEEGIPATFFVLPFNNVDDIFWRIINEGHELGNHTYTHNFRLLYEHPIEVFMDEVERAHEFILQNFGYRMISFRFPGGPFGRPRSVFDERREFVAQLGYREFSWHIDSGDSRESVRNLGAGELINRVLNYTEDLEHLIILFHDVPWSPMTLEALPYVIDGLKEQGYTFDIIRNYPFYDNELDFLKELQEIRRESMAQTNRRHFVVESIGWSRFDLGIRN